VRWILSLAVVSLVTSQVRAQPCAEEDALAEAAAELLLAGRWSESDLSVRARAAGSDLPALRAAVFPAGSARSDQWLSELASRVDAPLACGIAETSDRRLVIAAPRAGRLEVRSGVVRSEVRAGFEDAHLVFQDARGRMTRVAYAPRVEVPEELVAPLRVQLVATGPAGPRPVAERTVAGEVTSEIASDAPLPDRVDAIRDVHDARPLRRNRLLVREAERHARDVCRARVAAHVLEAGDPEERLRGRGIEARVVGEVVARAGSADEAFGALLRSPSHRITLTDRRFTDMGVGTAEANGRTCVVVSLAAWPRYVGR